MTDRNESARKKGLFALHHAGVIIRPPASARTDMPCSSIEQADTQMMPLYSIYSGTSPGCSGIVHVVDVVRGTNTEEKNDLLSRLSSGWAGRVQLPGDAGSRKDSQDV